MTILMPAVMAVASSILGTGAMASAGLNLLPQPASVKRTDGVYTVPERLTFLVAKQGALVVRATVQSYADKQVGRSISVKTAAGEGWWLIAGDANLPEAPNGEEAYRLNVTPEGIALVASSEAGFRQGVRTLLQLLGSGNVVPACEIDDRPAFPLRGIMICDANILTDADDNFYVRLVEEVAAWKMNAFFFHFTETNGCWIELKSHPEVVNAKHMTQVQLRKLVARAAELGVWVIPEVESWGHANWMLRAHPELAEGGNPYTFCLSKEEIYALLEDVIKEVAGLCPGPYIHLGCDEANYGVDDACKAKVAAIGADRMIAEHLNRLNRIAGKYGKTSIIWGDVILRTHRDAVKYLDPNIVIVDWNYRPSVGDEGLHWLGESGFAAMAGPAVTFSAWSLAPNWSNVENIRVFAGHAKAAKSLGVETTIWGGERILPGSAGLAFAWMCDQSWNPGGQDYKGAIAAYLIHRFGLEPTPRRVDRTLRLFNVGMPVNVVDVALWSNIEMLLKNARPDMEKENLEYAAGVKGLAKELARDLRDVSANRESFDALVVTGKIGEHAASRRFTAAEVVRRIRQAEEDVESGQISDARAGLLAAAKAIRQMEREHAKLLLEVRRIWARDYGADYPIWWFTKPEAHEYAKQLMATLNGLARKPDADGIRALLEARR